MLNYVGRSILTVVALVAFSLSLLAQTAAGQRPGGARSTPDLSGIWHAGGRLTGPGALPGGPGDSFGGLPAVRFTRQEPSLRPWALEKYRARREGAEPTAQGRGELDPALYPYCIPRGFPRVYMFDGFFELVQTPNRIYMLFELEHQVRRIYLDGRKHLENSPPSLMGVSHGRWDGETLVAETTNLESLNRNGWLDAFGHPFSEAMRVTERIRRTAPDTLQIDFVFDDPETYTRPWTGRKLFRLGDPEWDVMDLRLCEDHQYEDYLRDIGGGKPAGRP